MFRSTLSADDYQQRLQKALREIGDQKKLTDSRAPIIGLEITECYPDGAAYQAGIRARDVVFQVDNEITWGGGWKLTGKKKQKLYSYTPGENRIRTEFVTAERLSVDLKYYWRPELAFLRGRQRSKNFDEPMIVAAIMRGRDPDLAESCLHEAVRQGYVPDKITHQLGLEIALIQNRPEVAAAFAALLDPLFATDPEIHPVLILRAALANGRFDQAHRVLTHQDRFEADSRSGGDVDPETFIEAQKWQQEIITRYQGSPPVPAIRAQEMYHDDLEGKLQGGTYHSLKTEVPQLLRGDPLILASQVGGELDFVVLRSPEPVCDFDITAHFRIRLDDNVVPDPRINMAQVSLWGEPHRNNPDPKSGHRLIFAGLAFDSEGDISTIFGGFEDEVPLFDSSLTEIVGPVHRVRFVRVGSQLEIFLNGHRVLLAPAEEEIRQMEIEFRVAGMTLEIQRLEFQELIERPKTD